MIIYLEMKLQTNVLLKGFILKILKIKKKKILIIFFLLIFSFNIFKLNYFLNFLLILSKIYK